MSLLRKYWGTLAQGAIFVLAVLNGFLPPPPVAIAGGDNAYSRLAQFVVAIVIGLTIVVARLFRRRSYVRLWWSAALVLLLLSVAAFISYQRLTDKRTCVYLDETVVVGGDADLTEQAREFLRDHPEVGESSNVCTQLLDEFASEVGDVWTRKSVARNRLLLATAYLSCLPLFTICLIATVQAIYCLDAAE